MNAERRIRCTVTAMNYSACGLEIGDYFEVGSNGLSLPPGRSFCFYAVASVLPLLGGRLAGEGPDTWLAGRPLVACPDPPENLQMQLEEVASDGG